MEQTVSYMLAAAAVGGFAVTAVTCWLLIPVLHRLHFGQTIREEGPTWHNKKNGTPTMGGLGFVFGILVTLGVVWGLFHSKAPDVLGPQQMAAGMLVLFLAFGSGLIGFLDDFIKVVKKRNLGLTARQKTFLQLLVAAGYLLALYFSGMDFTILPFIGSVDIVSGWGLLFWPVALIFIYGFTNAVNLTDGIDGLATSVTLVVSLFYMLAAGILNYLGINLLAAALAGSCVGFLLWNFHPAKIFMGDTGSMFLGGMVVALAFGVDRPVLLFLAGILYLMEAMSVVIQVTYYKKTKKRLFKMSPIHHHFEMSGWREEKIVLVFSAVALIGCALAMLPVYFNW